MGVPTVLIHALKLFDMMAIFSVQGVSLQCGRPNKPWVFPDISPIYFNLYLVRYRLQI